MSAVPRSAQILLVGQRIRQLRKSRHLTQADLSARIGIAQSDLSRMENGEYKVALDVLFRILQVFELSMGEFFEEPTETKPEPVVADDNDALLADLRSLSESSQREVREFIAFKRLQAEARLGQALDSSRERDTDD